MLRRKVRTFARFQRFRLGGRPQTQDLYCGDSPIALHTTAQFIPANLGIGTGPMTDRSRNRSAAARGDMATVTIDNVQSELAKHKFYHIIDLGDRWI